MQIKTHIQKIILTVALAGILLGCGGGGDVGGGSQVDQTRGNQVKSVSNAKAIASALPDRKPTADEWCEVVLNEMSTLAIFISPQHPDKEKLRASLPKSTELESLPKDKRVSHYAFNMVLSGKIPEHPFMVVIFECDLGWNGAGGLEDALKYMEKHKLEKIAVSQADGSSRSVTKEELKKLKWDVAH